MKTMIATAALTIAFLSAGAFAGNTLTKPPVKVGNVTVIAKNQSWPVKPFAIVFPELCRINRCINV